MKFRFYQLMYVAALVLTILAMLDPVASFSESNGAVAVMSNFKYVAADGDVSRSVIALGILLVFTALVNLAGLVLALYNNFELQKRVTILSMLLFAGYYVLFLVYTLILSSDVSMDIKVPMLYPFMGLTLNFIAFILLRRCEAKIVARALGFRLRD